MKRSHVALAAGLLILAAVWLPGQRIGDMRDPDLRYDEGWVLLFNGKDFGKLVVMLKTEDGKSRKHFEATMSEQKTFYIEDGLLKTTGTPNGYIRTSDVYDNYVFHVEVRFRSEAIAALWSIFKETMSGRGRLNASCTNRTWAASFPSRGPTWKAAR